MGFLGVLLLAGPAAGTPWGGSPDECASPPTALGEPATLDAGDQQETATTLVFPGLQFGRTCLGALSLGSNLLGDNYDWYVIDVFPGMSLPESFGVSVCQLNPELSLDLEIRLVSHADLDPLGHGVQLAAPNAFGECAFANIEGVQPSLGLGRLYIAVHGGTNPGDYEMSVFA